MEEVGEVGRIYVGKFGDLKEPIVLIFNPTCFSELLVRSSGPQDLGQ
jgi:hypothetical protein